MKSIRKKLRLVLGVMTAACVAFSMGCEDRENKQAEAKYIKEQQQIQAQQNAQYELQLKKAEAVDKRYEALLARWEEQARRIDTLDDRYEALLARWEEQAGRADALLDRWDQNLGAAEESISKE